MLKKKIVVVLFSVVVAVIVWILAAYFWALKRVWLPEVPEIRRLLIGLVVPTNIAIFIVVFIATYVVIVVLAFKVKPLK